MPTTLAMMVVIYMPSRDWEAQDVFQEQRMVLLSVKIRKIPSLVGGKTVLVSLLSEKYRQ